jgi:hypothetical protein
MKKIILIVTLFILTVSVKGQVTPQWNAPNPGVSNQDSLRYFYPGIFGSFKYLWNTNAARQNLIQNTTVLQHANLTIDQTATANAFVGANISISNLATLNNLITKQASIQQLSVSGTGNGTLGFYSPFIVNNVLAMSANGDVLTGGISEPIFTTGLPALTTKNIVGGSLYVDGIYPLVVLFNSARPSGINPTATITVFGGAVTSVIITNGGARQGVNDVLVLANPLALGGAGSGFNCQVATTGAYTGGQFFSWQFQNAPAAYNGNYHALYSQSVYSIVDKKYVDSVNAVLGAGYVPTSRNITTGYGTLGGGDLTADRTLSADTASTNALVSKSRLAANLAGYAPEVQVPFKTPEQFGATHSSDATTALQNAVNSGYPIVLSRGGYIVSKVIHVPANAVIIGCGIDSLGSIKTTVDSAIFSIEGSFVKIKNVGFWGTGDTTQTAQHGIDVKGHYPTGAEYDNIDISFCGFHRLGQGVYSTLNGLDNPVSVSTHYGMTLTGNIAEYCAIGYNFDYRSEYNIINGCVAFLCGRGIRVEGGNNNISSCIFSDNFVFGGDFEGGVALDNDGHSTVTGTSFNHCGQAGIFTDGITLGYTFASCNVYSNIYLANSTGIRFENLNTGTTALYVQNCTNTTFHNTQWNVTPSFNLSWNGTSNTGTNSVVDFFGDIWIATPPVASSTLVFNKIRNGLTLDYTPNTLTFSGADSLLVRNKLTGNVGEIAMTNWLENQVSVQQAGAGLWTAGTGEFDGGFLKMNNTTSNILLFNPTNIVAPPSFTTRSVGTRIVIAPAITGSTTDYGFGEDSGVLWSSVATTSQSFKWYGGVTLAATLSGTGVFTPISIGSAVTATTQIGTDKSTKIATTAFVGNNFATITNPTFTGTVTLASGTTTVAPLVIPVAVGLLVSPLSGSIENDGTNLYYTNSLNSRSALQTTVNLQTTLSASATQYPSSTAVQNYVTGLGYLSASATTLPASFVNSSLTSVGTLGSLAVTATVTAGKIDVGALTYSDTNILGIFQSSANTYNQLIIQNSNSGSAASSDVVVNNNNSTATTFYGDFGMNSSGWVGSGALNVANNVYLTSTSADLAIGTTTSNAIHFVVNNGATDAMTISSAGVTTIPGLNIAGGIVQTSSAGVLSSSVNIAGVSGGRTLTGGTGITDILTLQGTSGNGTSTSAAIDFNVGNAGATVAGAILNNGWWGFGTGAPTNLVTLASLSSGAQQAWYNSTDQTTNYSRLVVTQPALSTNGFWTFTSQGGGTLNVTGLKGFEFSNSTYSDLRLAGGGTSNSAAMYFSGSNNSTVGFQGLQFNYNIAGTISSGITPATNFFLNNGVGTGTSGWKVGWFQAYDAGTGSGTKMLIDAGTNSANTGAIASYTSKFSVDNNGLLYFAATAGTANQVPIVNSGGTGMTWTSNIIQSNVANTFTTFQTISSVAPQLIFNRTTMAGGVANIPYQSAGVTKWTVGLNNTSDDNYVIGNATTGHADVTFNNTTDNAAFFATVQLKGYTVATLPTGVTGMTAYVTDALTPSFGITLVGGGTIVTKAFYNGTNWIAE